jgi:hypothetical protein
VTSTTQYLFENLTAAARANAGAVSFTRRNPMSFTGWEVLQAAGHVLANDIDPDDSYAVEQFLRKRYPRQSKKFISAAEREAVELRNRNRLHGLFEYINQKVPAWPGKREISGEFKLEIADDVSRELHRLMDQDDDQIVGDEMDKIVRCVALLLIEQAAWRKSEDEIKASYEKFAAKEGLV